MEKVEISGLKPKNCPFCNCEMSISLVGRDWIRIKAQHEHTYECILWDAQHDFPCDQDGLRMALDAWDNRAYPTVFGLYEVHAIEGPHLVALFATRKAALKSGLALRRKRVQQALDGYRSLGEPAAEYCYRHCWENIRLCVEEETIYDDLSFEKIAEKL